MATINNRLKFILPIVLAMLIPLLGILSEEIPTDSANFVQNMLIRFLLILAMWHLILVIRQWREKESHRRNLAITLSLTGIFVTISYYYFGFSHHQPSTWALFARLTFIGLTIFMIQQIIWTQEKVTTLLLEKEQLQSENLKIQLKELRNQMDPHFFFNSLNTLRSMVRQNHVNSEQFIIGLSDFYRQLLQHNENTTLPLREEISVAKSYLFLMKNRNEKALHIDLEEIEEKYNLYKIPTLALQSVIENCFKHNSMSSKMPLKIKIRTTDDAYIQVTNNFQPKFSPQKTSGLGLDLLKKRYQLLENKDGVIINSTDDSFSVKLKLILA